MIYSVKCNVSKNGKKYICLVDDTGKVVSVDRNVINALIGIYCYDTNSHFERTINEFYNGSLVIHISIERS